MLSSAATPIDSLVQPCEACRLLLARLDYEACIEGEEFAYTFLEARYFIQTGERTRGLRLTA